MKSTMKGVFAESIEWHLAQKHSLANRSMLRWRDSYLAT